MINIETNSIDLILINNKENNNVNEELHRVLKPGGYLFSIDKPNKSHNSVCDIEDIGFLIKDSISYFFKENEDVKQDVICLAMKPLSEKNFADNVMKWGTGALNIDGTRIEVKDIVDFQKNWTDRKAPAGFNGDKTGIYGSGKTDTPEKYTPEGRYPANFIISKDIAPVLDKQSGYSKSSKSIQKVKGSNGSCYGNYNTALKKEYGVNDEGGASRFFKNVDSQKELLKYLTVMGLPPKQGKVLFLGFDNTDEILKEINKESNVNYEAITIGGIE